MYAVTAFSPNVQLTEGDLKDALPGDTHTLTFSEAAKIRELAKRVEAGGTSEARQMFEHGIEIDRCGCYLKLTPGQHRKLRTKPRES
jgi:hypothetical protein